MARPRLTPEQEQQRRSLYQQGLSDREIGRRLGLDGKTIGYWRASRGLPSNHPLLGPMTADRQAQRRQLYNAGWSDAQIARRQGVTEFAVAHWRRLRQLPANATSGSQDWWALHPRNDQRERVAALVADGLTDRQGADLLGITRNAFALRRLRLGLTDHALDRPLHKERRA